MPVVPRSPILGMRGLPSFVVAPCAVGVIILCAASLANCVGGDDGVEPTCVNGGLACLDGATFEDAASVLDASRFTSPDGAVAEVDGGASASDAGAPSDATPTDAPLQLDAPVTTDAAEDAHDAAPLVDAGPQPTRLATYNNPLYVTVGGGFVYWTGINNQVNRVSINGGAVTTISTVGGLAMTADANNMYWIGTDVNVYQVAHTSTTPIKIGSVPVQSDTIVTDGTYVYWNAVGINSSFFRVPIGGGDGGAVTPSVLRYPSGITFAGGVTYLAVANSGGGTAPGSINMLPGDGGLPVPLISGRSGPQQLITDGTRLYWVEDTGITPNGIFSSAFDGGSLFAFTQNELHPKIATDGTWLYYTDTEYVLKRPADGSGTVTKLYTTGHPGAMAQDANNLYWADQGDNAIYRGAKY